ncbi:hypothetical protein [Thiolapillus sp.]|uniref:hypothetical protein n=3 Tax=Thiolapillus sp. TaxID=2017437 RepID=UPI003AF91755
MVPSSCGQSMKMQACLRPRDRFWDIPVPKIDSAFDNLLVPQPSWSPSTTQQLRKLVAAPYLAPNDWTPRSEAYFVFPLAQGTPGKQCGLAATGVYQPSLRSPWLAAVAWGMGWPVSPSTMRPWMASDRTYPQGTIPSTEMTSSTSNRNRNRISHLRRRQFSTTIRGQALVTSPPPSTPPGHRAAAG